MMKKIFRIGILFLAMANPVLAQSTSSPYTVFGEGFVENNGTGTNHALGGTGIAFKSHLFLNPINPASYNGIDSMSVLIEAGLFGKATQYSTSSKNSLSMDGNIAYLGMGFRYTRWWSNSLGILPFSTVGYTVSSHETIDGEFSNYLKTFQGNGGITKYYWGHTLSPTKNLSLGFNLSYYLGSITRSETGSTNESTLYTISNTSKVNGYNLDYGIQYTLRKDEFKCTLGATYNTKKKLSTKNERIIKYADDTISLNASHDKFYIPEKYGFGISIEKGLNIKAGFDYEKAIWDNNTAFSNPLLSTRNSERYSFGCEYTPYRKRSDPAWKKTFYRIGVNYQETYLIIDNNPINKVSFVLGAGIPLKKELSIINLSLEAGKSGTYADGLIKANFLLLHINFTIHEKWFMKYTYD